MARAAPAVVPLADARTETTVPDPSELSEFDRSAAARWAAARSAAWRAAAARAARSRASLRARAAWARPTLRALARCLAEDFATLSWALSRVSSDWSAATLLCW